MSERPLLKLDLSGSDGNVYVVMGLARTLLSGQMLEHLDADLNEATTPGQEKKYAEILAIVDKYVHLVDTSGIYREYAIDKDMIMAAIDHFNEQLETLPDTVVCAIEGLYPDFDDDLIGPEVYLSFVEDEIRWTVSLMAQKRDEHLDKLLTMLRELVSALRSAGVGTMFRDD
jgi:hypothetical protein